MQITNTPFTVIAFIGISIMVVDFALEAERQHGPSSAEAICEAGKARLRPS